MNAKKLVSLVLALVMVLALSTSAMAANVENETNHDYKAYQIFSGTQATDGGALGRVGWGTGIIAEDFLAAIKADSRFVQSNANIFTNCTTAADVANVLSGYSDNTDVAKAFADVAANYLNGDGVAVPANEIATGLAKGYYLVVDVTAETTVNNNDAYNSALLQVEEDETFKIEKKYTVPEPEKKIVENNQLVDEADKSIGDTVEYRLKGTLPSNYADYDWYKYVFHDNMDAGLTFDGEDTVEVFLGDANGYNEADKITTGYTVNSGNECTDDCELEIVFNNLKTNTSITANTVIYVTFTATLNDQAKVNTDIPNKVKLEYSNNPNVEVDSNNDGEPDKTVPTGVTPEDEVVVYTTEVTIVKKDATTRTILPGAAFKITGDSANIVVTSGKVFVAYASDETPVEGNKYWELTDGKFTDVDPNSTPSDGTTLDTSSYVDENVVYKLVEKASLATQGTDAVEAEGFVNDTTGKLTFSGLGVGTYTITETVVPAGYNQVATITLVIGYQEDNAETAEVDESGFTYTWTGGATGNTAEIEVLNNSGSSLPETGGMGTTVLYIAGGLLVAAAVIMMINKRRAGAAE